MSFWCHHFTMLAVNPLFFCWCFRYPWIFSSCTCLGIPFQFSPSWWCACWSSGQSKRCSQCSTVSRNFLILSSITVGTFKIMFTILRPGETPKLHGASCFSLQGDRGQPFRRSETRVFHWQRGEHRARSVQVSVNGSSPNTHVWLAGLCGPSNPHGVLRGWSDFHLSSSTTIYFITFFLHFSITYFYILRHISHKRLFISIIHSVTKIHQFNWLLSFISSSHFLDFGDLRNFLK